MMDEMKLITRVKLKWKVEKQEVVNQINNIINTVSWGHDRQTHVETERNVRKLADKMVTRVIPTQLTEFC